MIFPSNSVNKLVTYSVSDLTHLSFTTSTRKMHESPVIKEIGLLEKFSEREVMIVLDIESPNTIISLFGLFKLVLQKLDFDSCTAVMWHLSIALKLNRNYLFFEN